MNPNDLESQLSHLGANWPVDSVADAVTKKLESVPAPELVRRRSQRLQWTFAGSVLILMASLAIIWTTIFAAPSSLAAQVKQAIRNAASAHIVITTTDANRHQRKGEIWYSRENGIRSESTGQIIVDDGTQQWTWNPTVMDPDQIVQRRTSQDGISMIAEMLSLQDSPADWRQSRMVEFDREIRGIPCEAMLFEPPENVTVTAAGDTSPSPTRILVWYDHQRRTIEVDCQHQLNEQWMTRRELAIDYNVEIPADKFTVQFPPSTRIVDADRVWSERFPLSKSLATIESGGLLFAVHEVVRCEHDMFYLVTSVRGTPEHLKQFPPKRRRMNLQVTTLDVAAQDGGTALHDVYKQAKICGTVEEGVDYLWWLAIPRKFFRIKDGVRIDLDSPSKLEVEPDRIRVPLIARYLDDGHHHERVNTSIDVNLPADRPSETLSDIATRVIHDTKHSTEGLVLFGEVKTNDISHVVSTRTTAADYSVQLGLQVEWLNAHDELPEGHSMPAAYPPKPIRLPRIVKGQVVDSEGTPVFNAKVTVKIMRFENHAQVVNAEVPQPWFITTDEQGHFEFPTEEPLLASNDLICIETEVEGFPKLSTTDYERQVQNGTLPIQRLTARRTIRGQFVDPEGNPLAHTRVRIWTMDEKMALWTSEGQSADSDGTFAITIPKDGLGLIEIDPKGFAPMVLDLPKGDTDFGRFEVKRGTSVTGRVVDRQGNGIAGTVVAIQTAEPKHLKEIFYCPSFAGARTDKEGRFTLPPFLGKCKLWVTDEAKDYGGRITVNGTRPNSIPTQTVELTGKEQTKEVQFRRDN